MRSLKADAIMHRVADQQRFVQAQVAAQNVVAQNFDMMHRAQVATPAVRVQKSYTQSTSAFADYHYKIKTDYQAAYQSSASRVKVQPRYNDMIAAPPAQSTIPLDNTSLPCAGQIAPQVVAYSCPSEYMSREFPVSVQQTFKLQQQGDQHTAYGSVPYREINLETMHIKAMQMKVWQEYVDYTRASPQAHAFVAHINELYAEFNHLFDRSNSLKEYQAAYATLLKIETVIHQIEQIKPLSYVLSHDIYSAVKHMQSPFLDIFLGNKEALTSTDMKQIAWALHGYYEKMAHTFDKKLVAFPQGKLKQVVDAYKSSSPLSKIRQSVSYYAVKGYRDLTIAQKQQQYHQMLKQQQQFLEHTCGIKIDGLSKTWQDRYSARQQSAHQSLDEKSFYTRTYMLQETTQAQLKQMGLDPRVFMQLRGNALQHTLQAEFVKVAHMAAGNKHALAESALNFAHTGALCNQVGRMQEAWTVADISWTIVDHMKAVGEGACEGVAQAWSMIRHPITFTQNLTANIGTACYELLCYRWHCLGVESRLMFDRDEQAIIEAALLDLHSERIRESLVAALNECSTRDLLKQATKACVDYKLTSKLFQSFGKLLSGVQQSLAKPLLPATHPVKAQLSRMAYEATFDPATKAYVIESMNKVCTSVQEFKHIAPAEFAAKTADQIGKGAKGVALASKDAVKATVDTNRLAGFKAGVQGAASTARVTEARKSQHGVSKTNNFPKKNVYHKDDLLAELSKFQGERFNVGQHTFLLDKGNLKHILTRHHPAFWDGSIKPQQTFISKSCNIEDLILIIKEVFSQNRGIILKNGTNMQYQVRGTVDGIKYVIGIKKGGGIRQFYIPIKE